MFQTEVLEEITTHILRSVTFVENGAVHEIMRDNTVQQGWPQMTIACWITKVTDTHSEHATLTTFPLQQWLHEAPPC